MQQIADFLCSNDLLQARDEFEEFLKFNGKMYREHLDLRFKLYMTRQYARMIVTGFMLCIALLCWIRFEYFGG